MQDLLNTPATAPSNRQRLAATAMQPSRQLSPIRSPPTFTATSSPPTAHPPPTSISSTRQRPPPQSFSRAASLSLASPSTPVTTSGSPAKAPQPPARPLVNSPTTPEPAPSPQPPLRSLSARLFPESAPSH